MMVSKEGFSLSKADFPIFQRREGAEPYVYLDSAATTHKPACVIEAMTQFYSCHYGTVYRGIYQDSSEVTAAYTCVRDRIRDLIHAKESHEIIFTGGTTSGLNQLAIAFHDSTLRGPIIVSEVEHHANVLSWELAARRVGNSVVKVRVDQEGKICLGHLEELLKQGAALVSLAHVSNVSGVIQPIEEIASLVHRYHALLCVDAAQSISHQVIDVQQLDIDFMVFSGHKIYGPTGIGVLYGKAALLELLPPVFGGGDMVDIYDPETPKFQSAPLRFEAGTPPIAEVIGLGKAVEYMKTVTIEDIAKKEAALTEQLLEGIAKIEGVKVIGTGVGIPRGALVSVVMEKVHPMDMGALLDSRGIAVRTGHLCAQPAMHRWHVAHMLRASLGCYNDEEDVRVFLENFQDLLLFLKSM